MTKDEIKEYRKILEKEFMVKDKEIETQLSYITIGSLGFFITINEKFIKIQNTDFKNVLILSLIFLFLTFVLILVRKSRTSHHDLLMMKFLDKMSPDSNQDDQTLLSMWNKSHNELKKFRYVIYFSLSVGIGLQVLFIVLNYNLLNKLDIF